MSDKLRQSLEENRSDSATRANMTLQEKSLNDWIHQQKKHEVAEFAALHDGYHPAQKDISFLRNNVLDNERSRLWKLIKSMPKGAILHAHFDSIVDVKWLISDATYRDNCQMKQCKDTGKLEFSFMNKPIEEGWLTVNNLRRSYAEGIVAFDAMIFRKLTLPDERMSDPKKWSLFLDCFMAIEGLITYLPIFKNYLLKKFQMLLDDGVYYIEERLVYLSSQLYDDKQKYPLIHTFELYNKTLEEFKRNNPRFIGAKIIFCGLKVTDKECCRRAMEQCIFVAKKYPALICGFDLVGYEDAGYPLIYYQEEIQWFREKCAELKLDLPFVWHAGETVDTHQQAHENVFDAISTDTKRIGHGLSIAKHPTLMEIIRKNGICIELCPISNRILNYTPEDMRLHPFLNFINAGVPITLSPDDPSIFGINNNPASYDYWIVLVSWNSVDLATLKMLIHNSISFSLASPSEKESLFRIFEQEWTLWLEANTLVCLA